MTDLHGVAAAVAASDVALLAPAGDRRAPVRATGPLVLEHLLDLGERCGVAVVASSDGARWVVPLVLEPVLRRATPGDGVAERLVALISQGDAEQGAFRWRRFAEVSASGERGFTTDQTNESVVVGDAAVVKWSIHLPRQSEEGSPAGLRMQCLLNAGFPYMPSPIGTLELVSCGAVQLLATVVSFLPGAHDGWSWAVEEVRALGLGTASGDASLDTVGVLAEHTALMHSAFAVCDHGAATRDDAAEWASEASRELDDAVQLVSGDAGVRLRERATVIREAYGAFTVATGTPLIPIHGDYHVGQVLKHPGGYFIVDFDGSPVVSAAKRHDLQPAAVDVVSMISSLDHVGRIVLRRTPEVEGSLVRQWIRSSQDAFLNRYRDTLAESGRENLLDERLLVPLRYAQEVREHLYAVRYLPDWAYVADEALRDLVPMSGG